jgi:flagellar basal-body rod modification protein FlgD
MKLFITELQHQDPMEPMDNYEMASQLAQFNSMQATTRMADNMEKMLEFQTSQNNLALLTLLDNEVQVAGNLMGVQDGQASKTQFTLAEDAAVCKIEIYDSANRLIWKQDKGAIKAGTYELEWDGKDQAGKQVPDGAYRYEVRTSDLLGEKTAVDYLSTGKVTGIQFENGKALLTLDGHVGATVDEIIRVQ